jgi:hypothetical protein
MSNYVGYMMYTLNPEEIIQTLSNPGKKLQSGKSENMVPVHITSGGDSRSRWVLRHVSMPLYFCLTHSPVDLFTIMYCNSPLYHIMSIFRK